MYVCMLWVGVQSSMVAIFGRELRRTLLAGLVDQAHSLPRRRSMTEPTSEPCPPFFWELLSDVFSCFPLSYLWLGE